MKQTTLADTTFTATARVAPPQNCNELSGCERKANQQLCAYEPEFNVRAGKE